MKSDYGLNITHQLSQLEMELYCFRINHTAENGGLGRAGHFRKASEILWPKLVWNPWLEKQIESLCENQWISWAGCGASGKTFGSALYALVWWLASPTQSSVILTSTTAKMIRKRCWANIQHLYSTCDGRFPGNMVDSKTTLQSSKGDDKNAIFAVAVLEGSTTKAVANIQGIHSPRILCIVDEATDTPAAAFEAASNLSKGCKEFQFLAIGNPNSRLDQHGRFSSPKAGWGSVSVDTDEWPTERGVCVRFDGMKSPNVKAGRTKHEYLITIDQVKQAAEFEGEASPKFWTYTRGFWAPEGVCRTVLSETLCIKHDANGRHIFTSKSFMVAGLDPAFGGGDRCVLRIAELGDLQDGSTGIQLGDTIQINVRSDSTEPVHYQIARQVREICESRGIAPNHLAIDATGEGGGLCDIIAHEWSPLIRRVEFGGKASERPVSAEDPRPAHEAYNNRVTELWFSVREWLVRGRLKGLDDNTTTEFCQRIFDDSKRRLILETKLSMKGRTGRSPDLADAACLVVELARQLAGGILTGSHKMDKTWQDLSLKFDSIHHEDNLYATAEG